MIECIVGGTGGFMGAVCRYLIGMIPLKEGCVFPNKTLMINIMGSFLIGIVTTFSSLALETTDMMKDGKMHLVASYTVLSVMLGVLAVFAGQGIVRKG